MRRRRRRLPRCTRPRRLALLGSVCVYIIKPPLRRLPPSRLRPGFSLPSRGQSGSLSSLRTLGGSSGPSLPPVLPGFGTMTASDSLFGFVPALSGSTLIRFPTDRCCSEDLLRRTEQGLSGYLGVLSPRATALYTVPADRSCLADSDPWQASPSGDRLAPGKAPTESAYSLVGLTMLKRRSLVLRPADSPRLPADSRRLCHSASRSAVARRPRESGYRVSESLPELKPFIQ